MRSSKKNKKSLMSYFFKPPWKRTDELMKQKKKDRESLVKLRFVCSAIFTRCSLDMPKTKVFQKLAEITIEFSNQRT